MTRLLIVSPTFHGYWRSIERAFAGRGYDVSTVTYDTPLRPLRFARKVTHDLPERFGRPRPVTDPLFTRAAVSAVEGVRPQIVVVVKGDRLGHAFWDSVDASGAARVTWLYDELRRLHYGERLHRAGPLASYSRADVAALAADGFAAAHVPLAFDPDMVTPDPTRRHDEVVFIGSRYGRRESDLLTLQSAGIPVHAYGQEWSRNWLDHARTLRLHRPAMPTSGNLSRAKAYAVQAAAVAALNAHGDQDGFTMRTFEVCGVGGVQLCDRPDVAEHYDVGDQVLVYTSTDELVDLARRARVDPAWSERIRERARARTLAEHTFGHRIAVLEQLWV